MPAAARVRRAPSTETVLGSTQGGKAGNAIVFNRVFPSAPGGYGLGIHTQERIAGQFSAQRYGQRGQVLFPQTGNLLAAYRDHPESIELNMQGVAACTRMQLDRAAYDKLLNESREEISAIQAALGS